MSETPYEQFARVRLAEMDAKLFRVRAQRDDLLEACEAFAVTTYAHDGHSQICVGCGRFALTIVQISHGPGCEVSQFETAIAKATGETA